MSEANCVERLVRWARGIAGQRDWITLQEFDHAATLHRSNGTTESIPCKWRDQECRITGRIRRQSNFGHGWATEVESSPNSEYPTVV